MFSNVDAESQNFKLNNINLKNNKKTTAFSNNNSSKDLRENIEEVSKTNSPERGRKMND
jgi:hypothetical protein